MIKFLCNKCGSCIPKKGEKYLIDFTGYNKFNNSLDFEPVMDEYYLCKECVKYFYKLMEDDKND